ncbi:MAG TPA: hypothetical protein VEF53_18670 [Patescibacteria group bacterium]|nr:hypothetical protein [Patescibacteria group bacterium]
MDRITNRNVDVEDKRKCLDVSPPERTLNLILNGPTLNSVNKDYLRMYIRTLYKSLKKYEDMKEKNDEDERCQKAEWIDYQTCKGYQKSDTDDEPAERCKECMYLELNKEG